MSTGTSGDAVVVGAGVLVGIVVEVAVELTGTLFAGAVDVGVAVGGSFTATASLHVDPLRHGPCVTGVRR
ncbi:MAG: hypothetical protein QM589_04595 [Thermomicrobiales bacterium]